MGSIVLSCRCKNCAVLMVLLKNVVSDIFESLRSLLHYRALKTALSNVRQQNSSKKIMRWKKSVSIYTWESLISFHSYTTSQRSSLTFVLEPFILFYHLMRNTICILVVTAYSHRPKLDMSPSRLLSDLTGLFGNYLDLNSSHLMPSPARSNELFL
ncbi:unnamed protein product [Albugo candida]|uniref:Uncharacterized protein n=1 Tax=Albugo candida TaxID=65357 RepID=A0A024GSD4_9STRA|nr:unnamed protein product [Albugo candida]|eukprot:CCI49638.1 unnamed protein product [Albugo candida]